MSKNSTHVWIRVDRVKKPLEASYSGSFKVKKIEEKTVTIILENGKEEKISIERIKPARFSISTEIKKPKESSLSETKPKKTVKFSPDNNSSHSFFSIMTPSSGGGVM